MLPVPQRLFLLSLLGFLTLSQSQSQQQQCSLCVDGAQPNLTKTIGGAVDGPSCSSLVDVEIDLDGCRELQVLGFQWCDCPTYPKDYFCPMCLDGFVDIPKRFKEIPGTNGKTCDERLFVKTTAVENCAEAMKPGFVCGCPDAPEPHCTICGQSVEDDSAIARPNALLTINGVGSYTCQELVDQAILGILTEEQCALVQVEAFDTCGCIGSNPSPLDGNEDTRVGEDANMTTPSGSSGSSSSSSTGVPTESDTSPSNKDDSGAISAFSYSARGILLASLLLIVGLMKA